MKDLWHATLSVLLGILLGLLLAFGALFVARFAQAAIVCESPLGPCIERPYTAAEQKIMNEILYPATAPEPTSAMGKAMKTAVEKAAAQATSQPYVETVEPEPDLMPEIDRIFDMMFGSKK